MMRKLKLLMLALFSFMALHMMGAFIPEQRAQQAALNLYAMQAGKLGQVAQVHTLKSNDEVVMYVFNFVGGGFAIISADDSFYPIIGYNLKGSYDPSRPQPEGFKGMMADYRDQILYLRQNAVEATEEIADVWNRLLEGRSLKNGSKGVDPLVPAEWNQDDPYNYLCPANASGPGGHVYAGCVATAMSQIMYYWRWPLQGQGSQTYYLPPYGYISANFGETQYNWNGMVNTCPNTLNLPIALISYHTGVSVKMNYGPTGSGAQSSDVPYAARTYFKYDNQIQFLQRQAYTATVWEGMVKEQIDQGNPVYYSGVEAGSAAGHAFVVDGYDDQTPRNFHFNFGWDGYMNGYYTLANAGGFTTQQAMVRNFKPGSGYPYYTTDFTEIKDMVGTLEDGSGPVAPYLNNASAKWLLNPQTDTDSVTSITVSFQRFDMQAGDTLYIYNGADVTAPLVGKYSGSSLPSQFTSNGNKVLLHMVTNGNGQAQGWLLNFQANRPTFCSGTKTYTDYSATFDDGSGSFNYVPNSNCMYKITPPYASSVTLYFDYFESEPDNDWLKVYDLKTQQLLATISGVYAPGTAPDPITSPSGQFYLIWKTDGAFNYKGWQVHYETLNVGMEPDQLFSEFHLWPNPVHDYLNLSFTSAQPQNLRIQLSSMTGTLVYSENLSSFMGSYEKQIPVQSLAKGIYILKFESENGVYTRKVVIR
ncbi:MAG: C10 family peptidase [Bacteroidales bacterium]